MASDLGLGRVLLSALLLVLAGCEIVRPVDGGPKDAAAEDTAGGFRQEVAFASGSTLIELQAPPRCALLGRSLEGQSPEQTLADLTFSWTPSGERRVYAGVFSTRPDIVDGHVVPVENAVWAWATGGARTDAGTVAWRQGFTPRADGLPDLESAPPATLDKGVYWFVTWAWDDTRALTWSSETRPFIWDPDALDGSAWCPEIEAEANPDTTARFWCVAPEQDAVTGIECLGWVPPDAPDAGTWTRDAGTSPDDGGA